MVLLSLVAGRCIPTFAQLDDLIDLVNTTDNFNASEVPDLSDLAFELTLSDILNGTLYGSFDFILGIKINIPFLFVALKLYFLMLRY